MLTVRRSERADRATLVGILTGVAAIAWMYLFVLASAMDTMGSAFAMPMSSRWSTRDWIFMSIMWAVMMTGMMLPSASPMIASYREFTTRGGLRGSTGVFASGYLVAWSTFAVAATALQWTLHNMALVTPMGVAASPVVGGAILVVAGGFQFTRMKSACLGQCRTPTGFLMTQWREGRSGALIMGMKHGTYCVGCCWGLMVLLFVLGVMNLLWVAFLAVVVLLEKVAPRPEIVTKTLGVALIVWGSALIVSVMW